MQSLASHAHQRSPLMRDGLVYMLIRQHQVSMRTSDSHINATELLRAAYSNSKRSVKSRLMSEIKSRGIGSAVHHDRNHHWWLPFEDGVFLCQVTGLEDELEPLLSYPRLVRPRRDDNYLLKMPGLPAGLAHSPFRTSQIVYDLDKRLINVTQLFRAANVSRKKLSSFWDSDPTVHRDIRKGHHTTQGSYVSLDTAEFLCQKYKIDWTPSSHFQTLAPIFEAATSPEQDDDAPGLAAFDGQPVEDPEAIPGSK